MHPGIWIVFKPVVSGIPIAERGFVKIESWQLGPADLSFEVPGTPPGHATVSEQQRESGHGFIGPFFWAAVAGGVSRTHRGD